MRFPASLLLLAFGLAQPPASANDAADVATSGQRKLGSLPFQPCSLKLTGSVTSVEAHCGKLAVAENRADPEGRKIELALAFIPASGDAEPDPIFMIAGGPGQSALESYPSLHGAFADLRRTRNVLLLDARGTGGSHPLVCRDSEGRANLTEGTDESTETARAFAQRCADTLSADADLRFYTTSEHIDDIDAVRQAAGVEQINLIGISYGTRVAQQYAARYPAHTRAVVLDSVVPNELVLGAEHARNLEDALDAHFSRCAESEACTTGMGDLRSSLNALKAKLEAGDLAAVRFRDARNGTWREAVPNAGHLAILLRMYAYAPATAATLPFLLNEAAAGHYAAMLAQAELIAGSMSEQIYHGMQLSVMCAEDVDELEPNPADADTVLGNSLIEFSKAQCAVWPKGQRDPAFRQPLAGDVPVLALSGEFDPVTPPRYGDAVIEHLPNGRHLVLKGQGHSVVGLGCAPKLFAQFIETADAKGLDASCLDRLRPLPPFTGPYGWEP
jgi:pimeloyl-ACP methyl ester carboxylesterase